MTKKSVNMSVRVTPEEYRIIKEKSKEKKITLQDLFIDGLYATGIFEGYEGIRDDRPEPKPKKIKTKKAKSGRKQKSIIQMKDNIIIRVFKNSDEIKEAGYNQGNVSRVCNGKAKTAHGFNWVFAKDAKK